VDAQEYIEARLRCRAEAARRLRWDKVPDAVWVRAEDLGLVLDVALHQDKDSWRELLTFLRTEREELSGRTSGRGGERPASEDIEIELEDNTRRRGSVYGEVAAAAAEQRSDVRTFRWRYLQGYGLTSEAAIAFLEGRDTGHPRIDHLTFDRRVKVEKQLRRLGSKLARFYGWRERDAGHFVLTGQEPVYQPVRVVVTWGESIRDQVPNSVRIVITADVWTDTEEVANAYRAARRQILGGDRRRRRIDDRPLEVVRFVTRQIREHGPDLKWPELQRRWNGEHPPGDDWHYADRNGLWRAYKRAYKRLWRPEYIRPKWKRDDAISH
jgi:hypothetical protein